MTEHRFLVKGSALQGREAVIAGREFHHFRVRRIRAGEVIWLTDGCGAERRGRVVRITRDRAFVQLLDEFTGAREPSFSIVLCLALVEPAALEVALQKATELGVSEFVLFPGARSSLRSVSPPRLERWQRIVREASKQSQRAYIPPVVLASSLADAVEQRGEELRLLLAPDTSESLCPNPGEAPPRSAFVVIGPEGGLAPQEVEFLEQKRFRKVAFGPRILRAETAALAACVLLQWHWGDWRPQGTQV
jgi:16S rRNA (uracil1498-N3)-methyltransferase